MRLGLTCSFPGWATYIRSLTPIKDSIDCSTTLIFGIKAAPVSDEQGAIRAEDRVKGVLEAGGEDLFRAPKPATNWLQGDANYLLAHGRIP